MKCMFCLAACVKQTHSCTHYYTDLPGVEVIGRTTFTVTNAADRFNWTEYGFVLTVPPNSLPAGVDMCPLDIIASTAGEYKFPDNHQLVSGVFWVRPSAPGRFRQQLTVEIQHCAKMTNSTKLSFVRARCSQESLPYRFRQVEGGDSFPEYSWYGSLKVTHFSGLAVVGKGAKIDYIASFYYHRPDSPLPTIEIYFTICKNTKVHITVSACMVCTFFELKIPMHCFRNGKGILTNWKRKEKLSFM